MRVSSRITVVIAIGLLTLLSASAYSAGREFVCLTGWENSSRGLSYPGNDYSDVSRYQGVPFLVGLLPRYDCPGSAENEHPPNPQIKISLRFVQGYSQLHLLQNLGFATDVPNGLEAGSLVVHYEDGSEALVSLVVGVNTAEWAYDRQDNQECLLHDKIPPAISEMRYDDQGRPFLGHFFYSSVDLDSTKRIVSIDFHLSEEACLPRPGCGDGELHTWFRVQIKAITLEL